MRAEPLTMAASGDHVFVFERVTGTRKGKTLDTKEVAVVGRVQPLDALANPSVRHRLHVGAVGRERSLRSAQAALSASPFRLV